MKQSREEINGDTLKDDVSVERVIKSGHNKWGVSVIREIKDGSDTIEVQYYPDAEPDRIYFSSPEEAINFCECVLKVAKIDGILPEIKKS